METIITIISLILIFYLLFKTKKYGSVTVVNDLIISRFGSIIFEIIDEYNLKINENMVFAVIKIESGYTTKKNNELIGDDGKSFGYMQISNAAFRDVTKNYKIKFSWNDVIDNYYYNIVAGSCYLDLCYKSALKENPNNSVWLAFKKYNGGIDETETSYNPNATNYANKCFSYYLEYKNLG